MEKTVESNSHPDATAEDNIKQNLVLRTEAAEQEVAEAPGHGGNKI
jgi:hypothetical protein